MDWCERKIVCVSIGVGWWRVLWDGWATFVMSRHAYEVSANYGRIILGGGGGFRVIDKN